MALKKFYIAVYVSLACVYMCVHVRVCVREQLIGGQMDSRSFTISKEPKVFLKKKKNRSEFIEVGDVLLSAVLSFFFKIFHSLNYLIHIHTHKYTCTNTHTHIYSFKNRNNEDWDRKKRKKTLDRKELFFTGCLAALNWLEQTMVCLCPISIAFKSNNEGDFFFVLIIFPRPVSFLINFRFVSLFISILFFYFNFPLSEWRRINHKRKLKEIFKFEK